MQWIAASDAAVARAVLERQRLDDFDVPGAQLRHQGTDTASGGAGFRQAGVHNEQSAKQRAGSSTLHHSASLTKSRRSGFSPAGVLVRLLRRVSICVGLKLAGGPHLAIYVELRARRTFGGSGLLPARWYPSYR